MLCRNCCTPINNTNQLPFAKEGWWPLAMPFPLWSETRRQGRCALMCKHTHNHTCLLCLLPRACASQPARQMSFSRIAWMTLQIQLLAQSQPWCPAAPRTTHGHAPCPQSFSNHLAHQEHKGKPKDTLKLGYVSLDGLTHTTLRPDRCLRNFSF